MSHARKRKTARRGRSLRVESLERRNLLAGDGFHNFLDPADVNNDNHVSAIDALTIINRLDRSEASGEHDESVATGYLDVNDDGHASAIDALMVINQLDSDLPNAGADLESKFTGAAGERVKVEVENENGTRKLEVKIQNGLPSSSFDVTINGTLLGSVTTNASGRGRLELRGFNANGEPLPSINAGDSLSVNSVGNVVLVGDDFNDDGINHVSHSPTDTPVAVGSQYGDWRASLSGVGSGTAEFERESRETEFEVEVRGLAVNSTLPVSIDGVVVGQIRTNSRGRGELEFEIGDEDYRPFPANFPTITAGSNIQVGSSLSGTFSLRGNGHDDDDRDDHDDDNHEDRHDRDDN